MRRSARKSKNFRLVQLSSRAGCGAGASAREGRTDRARLPHPRCFTCRTGGGPGVPLLWRFSEEFRRVGRACDLNAHIIDMARFITGDEIIEVVGSIAETFIKERAIVEDGREGGIAPEEQRIEAHGQERCGRCGAVLARFKQGAVASFEATRLATGNQTERS